MLILQTQLFIVKWVEASKLLNITFNGAFTGTNISLYRQHCDNKDIALEVAKKYIVDFAQKELELAK